MIGWLSGKIKDKPEPGKIVLDVSGVGYEVEILGQTFVMLTEQAPVGLHIQTLVREDAFLLYGFIDKQERSLFKALIKVNGIGPKAAMSILSHMTPTDLIESVLQNNIANLVQVPGIGKKTAERLVIEMKDSLKHFYLSSDNASSLTSGQNPSNRLLRNELLEAKLALEGLGYKPQEAQRAINSVDDGQKSCEMLIRQALQTLV